MQLSTGTHVATLLYVNVLFVGFPLVSRLVSILNIYILDTHLAMCKKKLSHSDGLFVRKLKTNP